MADRLRTFLDRPLDPRTGWAMLALCAATLVGLAAVFVLVTSEPGSPAVSHSGPVTRSSRPPTHAVPSVRDIAPRAERQRQDPQDEKGSAAGRRAAHALRSHRALQHVPYRGGGLQITLAGAREGRAVLAVSAPTLAGARRGWRAFLRRYRDDGRAYLPRFQSGGGDRG